MILFLHSQVEAEACSQVFERMVNLGTLIVPTFNYNFLHGKAYHHWRTPSQVGLFSEYVRRRGVRSFHPVYSCAGVGPEAKGFLADVSRSSFGPGSVFAKLVEADGRLGFYGVGLETCTFVHHVEHMLNVPYRFHKWFSGQVTRDETWTDSYEMFARYLDHRERKHDFGKFIHDVTPELRYRDGMTIVAARTVYDIVGRGLIRDWEYLLARTD